MFTVCNLPIFILTPFFVVWSLPYDDDYCVVCGAVASQVKTQLIGGKYSCSHNECRLTVKVRYTVPPTDTGSLCLAVDSTHTVVGPFRSLVRRSGTHCSQMNSEIRRVMLTASNSSLKQSCSAFTSVTSALEVNWRYALYKFTFYLLRPTYLKVIGWYLL